MIVDNELDLLFRAQKSFPPSPIEFVGYDPAYEINLNTREIETPKEVVVTEDHNATTFYFVVDRFLDYIDLSTMHCVILYNTNNTTHAYPVPYYDIYTLSHSNKIIFPWNLSESVTQQPGIVEFSVKFYKIKGEIQQNAELVYSLNTKPAKLKVSYGLDAGKIKDDTTRKIYVECNLNKTDDIKAFEKDLLAEKVDEAILYTRPNLTFDCVLKDGTVISKVKADSKGEINLTSIISPIGLKSIQNLTVNSSPLTSWPEPSQINYSYLPENAKTLLENYGQLFDLLLEIEKIRQEGTQKQCRWIVMEDSKTM